MLHEFMLPAVAEGTPALEDRLHRVEHLPSPMFFGCNAAGHDLSIYYRGHTHRVARSSEAIHAIFRDDKKKNRNFLLASSLVSRVRGVFFADMEDARGFDPEVYFDAEINIFQFNRRKGSRTAILWRLPQYYEPSPRLGLVDGSSFRDEISFDDKLPVVFWRGDISGCHWINPFRRKGALAIPTLTEMRAATHVYSRYKAVLEIDEQVSFVDFKFGGYHASQRDDLVAAGRVDAFRNPSDFLQHKYVLCPNGNDVSTLLYWIIKSGSLAFREECSYEVLPDYFLKPWVHYVPIANGLHDLQEKFEFCESNPDMCRRMIEQANMAYAKIQQKDLWEEAENIVLDRLGLL